MKVKCIKTTPWHDSITIGKTYDVIRENKNWYWIINDEGKEDFFPKKWFKPTVE